MTPLLLLVWIEIVSSGTPKKALHSSCFELDDGSHYLQILTNDELSLLSQSEKDYLTAPIVHVRCYSGYTIIDPLFDSSWVSYFSSYHNWKTDTAGPDLDDHVTWAQWFLPSLQLLHNQNSDNSNDMNDMQMTYTVSPDCTQCIINNHQYTNKVYYMSGDIFSCHWSTNKECTNDCSFMTYDVNTPVFIDHSHCFEQSDSNKMPSIGTNGNNCICYKPLSQTDIKPANWGDHYALDSWDDFNNDFNNENDKFDGKMETELQTQESSVESAESVDIELYQSDFDDGTYRITKPGTYTLMENIKFNFNPGGTKHPNSNYAWMPNEDTDNAYPGAAHNNNDGYYSHGFWAGITIETNGVSIDLNGYTLAMEYVFYIQQRFFVCIALMNKISTDRNGITFDGIGFKSANDILIRNGVIGLSSHMGIYGIENNNVRLANVVVRDFETHGIVMREYNGLEMKNIEIGPSVNGQLKVNMRYTNARLMLPNFYSVAKENMEGSVRFGERGPFTMNDIIDRLVDTMDLAFEYAMNGLENIDSESERWREAKQLFVIENGISEYTTLYGLVLKPNKESGYSTVEDLYIHDLIINPKQIIKIGVSDDLWLRNSFTAPIDLSMAVLSTDDESESVEDRNVLDNIESAIYFGDVYTDALMAMRQLSDSWWSLGGMVIWKQFIEWTQSGSEALHTFYDNNSDEIYGICGYDSVNGLSKGIIGIEIADCEHMNLANVVIENLINMGSLQHSKCKCDSYEGTHARAISVMNGQNINIEQLSVNKIVAFNGPSYGIFNSDEDKDKNGVMTPYLKENIITLNYATFSHIDAGVKSTYDRIDMTTDNGFNSAALSCSIYCVDSVKCEENIKYYGISEQCMNGQTKCSHEYTQMMIHHECQMDADYSTPIGTIYVDRYGGIKAELIDDRSEDYDGHSRSIVFRGEYFAVAIIVILAILAAIKCLYFKQTNEKNNNEDAYVTLETVNENSPLLSDNDQIDYDNL